MSNKLSKSKSDYARKNQSKFDGYICQSCEERNLQIEYAPSEWSIDISKINIEYLYNRKLCKWYKNL